MLFDYPFCLMRIDCSRLATTPGFAAYIRVTQYTPGNYEVLKCTRLYTLIANKTPQKWIRELFIFEKGNKNNALYSLE